MVSASSRSEDLEGPVATGGSASTGQGALPGRVPAGPTFRELEQRVRNRDLVILVLAIAVVVGFGRGLGWILTPFLVVASTTALFGYRVALSLNGASATLSTRSRDRVVSDLYRGSCALLGLTLLALVGQFHAYQVSSRIVSEVGLSVASMIALVVSIAVGCGLVITVPIYRTYCGIVTDSFDRLTRGERSEISERLERRFDQSDRMSRRLEKWILGAVFLQPATFLLGVGYLVIAWGLELAG